MKQLILCLILFFPAPSKADTSKSRSGKKTQEVNFDGSDIDGMVRSPDGAYLVQKRGIDFMPLYKLKKEFDTNIKESVEYLR